MPQISWPTAVVLVAVIAAVVALARLGEPQALAIAASLGAVIVAAMRPLFPPKDGAQ